jgi:molecular chaperone DnaJ
VAAKDLYEKDFYKILGVNKGATNKEIKKKYRELAHKLHPDKNTGNKKFEEEFKAVSEAYEILSEDKSRAEYDEARSLFERGAFRQPQSGFQGGNQGGQSANRDYADLFGGADSQDIFANLFGGGRRAPRKGQDLQTESTITFRESIFGTNLDLRLTSDGGAPTNITVRVPAGVKNGGKIRIRGKGARGEAGPGDLFIHLNVKPHPIFTHKGENLLMTLPVTFSEAALGADIRVPTLSGEEVTVRLAPGTSNGRVLRIKGHGVKGTSGVGDLLVSVEVQVPQRISFEARKALEEFAAQTSDEDVRAEFKARAKL